MSDGGFTEFVHSRWAGLVRLAYPITLDTQRAEDLTQEALVKLWFSWPKVRDENPDGFVRTVLIRLAISSRRRRWLGERPTDVLPEQTSPTQFTDDAERRLDIIALLALLSPRQRAVVVLRFLEDLSEQDVAAVLGCSPGSVKQHTSRALAKLRASAGPDHLAEVGVQGDGGDG